MPGLREETLICQWVIYAVLCQAIDIFGTVTNIINIICFVRQGFTDAVNVSLLGLAISDLGCLVSLIWTNISFTPAFSTADWPFEPIEVNYLVSATIHVTFSRITTWITALIAAERCLCIIAPLKVKSVVTPRRVSVVIVAIFLTFTFSVTPVYVVNKLDMKFSPYRNKTILGLVHTEDRANVELYSLIINNFVVPFSAFFIIIICTITLAYTLNDKSKWRVKSAKSAQANRVSNRNQKVAKMVIMISTLFIICFIPLSVSMLAMAVEPAMYFGGQYLNLAIILGGVVLVIESVNSSANIFIYYHMSSNYRQTFRELFGIDDSNEQDDMFRSPVGNK